MSEQFKCSVCSKWAYAESGNGYDRCDECPEQPTCPEDCQGFEVVPGVFSGCRCYGNGCDCPNHPEPTR